MVRDSIGVKVGIGSSVVLFRLNMLFVSVESLRSLARSQPFWTKTSLPSGRTSLIVGPEGGLTAEEVRGLVDAGAVVASLGPRLLRTETAGAVAVALLQSRYGDLGRA